MRLLRWKSKYQVGEPKTDSRTRSFVDTLNAVITEANSVEHCEDLSVFTDGISTTTEEMLNSIHQSPVEANGEIDKFENELRNILVSKLPLAARGTPACDDCGMCSLLEKQCSAWLGDEFTDRAKSK